MKYKNWTSQEIIYLKENYGKIYPIIIAKKLKRNLSSIYIMANRLNLYSKLRKSSPFKNKTYEEIYGKERANKIKNKQQLIRKDKTWEEIFGIKKSKKLKIERGRKFQKLWENSEYRKSRQKIMKKVWKNPILRIQRSNLSKKMWQNPKYKKMMSKKLSQALKGKPKPYFLGNKNPATREDVKKRIKLAIHRNIKKYSKASKKLWENPEYRKKVTNAIRVGLKQKPTLPEKQMIQIIKLNNLPFNYVGDGKVIFNGFNPDFLSKNPKHIIEVYGEFWHNLPKRIEADKRRIKAYNSLGYKLLVIWSKELENPNKVTEKIMKFML
jgi:very-short-patch-repair endonuclease